MLICHCMQVCDAEIRLCKSLEEVRERTFATLGCGGCLPSVINILQNSNKDQHDVPRPGLSNDTNGQRLELRYSRGCCTVPSFRGTGQEFVFTSCSQYEGFQPDDEVRHRGCLYQGEGQRSCAQPSRELCRFRDQTCLWCVQMGEKTSRCTS